MGKTLKTLKISGNKKTLKNISKKNHLVITKFKKMIDDNPIEKEYMNTMITSISKNHRYKNHPKTVSMKKNADNDLRTIVISI